MVLHDTEAFSSKQMNSNTETTYTTFRQERKSLLNTGMLMKMKNIIIVDDEPAMVRITSKKLERLGYLVTGTTDPKEALNMVASDPGRFDLMITDMVMPKLSGAQLSKVVLQMQPNLPIILISGFCSLSPDESKGIGINKILQKPVDLVDLASAVAEALKDDGGT